ncbi:hypothetical protein [uncultured Eudoraea sp.]|uniref:hypothetical protein n=1 Tax=uncultured Eudoraea sp. TaxID=1035614 RepID=UPI00262FA3DD|nr:hypothetical protein [uncultured Eudoraea sp.]
MKKITGIAVALVLIVIYAFAPYNEAKTQNTTETKQVYAIHEIELKAETDTEKFESLVLNKIAPIYDKMEGQKLILVKGDRGIRAGKYSILLTFTSIEDRDRIYPPSGEMEADFGDQAIWNKFDTMVVDGLGKTHTDYVKVIQ